MRTSQYRRSRRQVQLAEDIQGAQGALLQHEARGEGQSTVPGCPRFLGQQRRLAQGLAAHELEPRRLAAPAALPRPADQPHHHRAVLPGARRLGPRCPGPTGARHALLPHAERHAPAHDQGPRRPGRPRRGAAAGPAGRAERPQGGQQAGERSASAGGYLAQLGRGRATRPQHQEIAGEYWV